MDRRILAVPILLIVSIIIVVMSLALGLALILDDLPDFVPGTDQFKWIPDWPYSVFFFGIQIHHLFVGVGLVVISIVALVVLYWYRSGGQ